MKNVYNARQMIAAIMIAPGLFAIATTLTHASEVVPSTALSVPSEGLGPTSVQTQIGEIETARKKDASTWPTFPSFDEYGFSLAADYNLLYQHLNNSQSDDDAAAGGVIRLYGTWTPFNDNSIDNGKLVFKVEQRHRLGTDLPPQVLLPAAGIAGISGPTFSNTKGLLTNFYWTQSFANNRFALNVGVVDITDYTDVYGLVNSWTEFNNLAFSTNPTIPAPSQGLGLAMRWMFTPNFYVIGGIADANGDPHNPEDFFDSFFNESEFFKHIEIGHIGSWENRFVDNTHITLWQVDSREKFGIDDGWGVALSWSHQFGEWLPFIRAGYSDGGGSLVDRSISSGVGYTLNERGDYIGFGANWGQSTATSTADNNINQYTFETYYKLQLLNHLQIVPSVQYVSNPAFDPTEDHLWVFAIRMRATF